MLLGLAAFCSDRPAAAASSFDEERPQTVVHLLDYVSVEYPTFVRDGQVLNPSEYAEQREFAAQAVALLEQLPAAPDKATLLEEARGLQARIEAKADGPGVATLAASVRADVIRVYALTVAPRDAPDERSGARLFETHCSTCHGAQGRGDGAAARGMDPKPADFHDEARMDLRSLYGLYNTITLGVNGTPMRAFTDLSESDRWALAFFVANLRSGTDQVTQGEALWKQGQGRASFGDLRALVTVTRVEARRSRGKASSAVSGVVMVLIERPTAASPINSATGEIGW